MSRASRSLQFSFAVVAILGMLLISRQAAAADQWHSPRHANFTPDPASVVRFGPAWRYPQDGWIVLHIEGSPYDRGYQHGRLLAREIADYIQSIAEIRSHEAPAKAWKDVRLFVNALFLRRFHAEYLEEMKGIADGAAAAGAKFDGRRIDLLDVVVINSDVELGFLESALEATANGLDRMKFTEPRYSQPKAPAKHRCSAFVATGPATGGGQIVAGHITMTDLSYTRHLNVWLDVQPSDGHRIVMQSFPAGIQSGLDYYINSGGLIVSETTIRQTKFNPQGEMLASRIRRALQYANSIDRVVDILSKSNNGLYTNEWLIGDIKTGEIAMFELGTDKTRLWRSSRDEWPAGTKGFYWGCNNAKDIDVFKETVPDLGGKPANLVLYPRSRDKAWLTLFDKHRGKIDEAFGFEAFSTTPLAAFPSCDAKFTTSALAKNLQSWAIFGPPLGHTWTPTKQDREDYPNIEPLVVHDWTMLDIAPPAQLKTQIDLADADPFPDEDHDKLDVKWDETHPFAWRGTLFPKSDADTWLAAAFAEYEQVVAFDLALQRSLAKPGDYDAKHADEHDTKLRHARDAVDLALFQHESHWLTAARRIGRDIPLAETRSEPHDNAWYHIASGKGVLLLASLRSQLGADKFDRMLDEFGQKHAGQAVTTAEFRQHLERSADTAAVATLDKWLTGDVLSTLAGKNPWHVFSFEAEPELTLIVYGTQRDAAAQREAAELLAGEVARRFSNIRPPIKPDTAVTDDDLRSRHLLLIGRPVTNSVTSRCVERLPVKFDPQSFTIRGETFSHHASSIVVAGDNPRNARYSVVVFAGLDAESTWRSVQNLPTDDDPPPQVILKRAGRGSRHFRVQPVAKAAVAIGK
ncbi:MAG: hypothetical protein HZA46_17215 [Planctomycetales bacterium]|nr:hypothetical protein [Planctomycetales bacterium]